MKRTIIILSFAFLGMGSKAQTTAPIEVPQNKTFNLDKPKDEGKLTTNKATLKGEILPVYVTGKGKLFIKQVSAKTGKEYRKYIKTI